MYCTLHYFRMAPDTDGPTRNPLKFYFISYRVITPYVLMITAKIVLITAFKFQTEQNVTQNIEILFC